MLPAPSGPNEPSHRERQPPMNSTYTNTDPPSQADRTGADRERTRRTRMPLPDFFGTVAATEREAAQWLIKHRWPDGVRCPRCGSHDFEEASQNAEAGPRFRCTSCRRSFTVRTHHFTDYPAVPFRHWLLAMRLMVSQKQFWSEAQIAHFLGLDHVTTRLVIHAIHLQMRAPDPLPLKSVAGVFEAQVPPLESLAQAFEADEAYWPKQRDSVDGVLFAQQLYTVLVLERASRQLRIWVVPDRNADTMLRVLKQSGVGPGSTLYSDGLRIYRLVARLLKLKHGWVNHSDEVYVDRLDPRIHINGAESAFAWMRHALARVEVSQENLTRYAAQCEFLFNRRETPAGELMGELASREHGSLTPERLAAERSRFAPRTPSPITTIPLWLPHRAG